MRRAASTEGRIQSIAREDPGPRTISSPETLIANQNIRTPLKYHRISHLRFSNREFFGPARTAVPATTTTDGTLFSGVHS